MYTFTDYCIKKCLSIIFLLIGTLTIELFAQQININRVDLMPNMPSPYQMRDWKNVALGYDSLVFDYTLTGQYLPLIFWYTNTINYPNHNSFGLHSYVGTSATNSGEAINVLPAVISASLVDIDKSNQNGQNWVLMCEEYFNRRPTENVYLNNPVTSSGNDWWYDTMPNVFFYQLYDMYPNTGDFAFQFTSVADRWLEAVDSMGGGITPWQRPYMNYRAWHLSSMTPNSSGVPEPEAAGTIAWLLYNAYLETGVEKYRIGAEWAMEFLSNWITNPSYELQLSYGAYIAAKMNAELGTTYNIEKIVNWCFDIGSLRNWGVIVGNWGGYDCYGLVGEALDIGNYAFYMNGVEQVGALVPMVRYDDRFARAIGKWVLNVANASRLMYSNYLPDTHQSNPIWAHQYDRKSYIAYEAMRRIWNGFSPFATGDAMSGGWAATNLGLYGSSHVGILGGIIDTTNVPMILKLDVLQTDYFNDTAYPTYLYFNPYSNDTMVLVDVGSEQHDLYDAISNSFIATNVSGNTYYDIAQNSAVLLVITPTGGTVTYNLDKMLINGVIVDYQSGQSVINYPPRIKSLGIAPDPVIIGHTTTVYCTAEDKDNHPLNYIWSASSGTIIGIGAEATWIPPNLIGNYEISCIVADWHGGLDTASVSVEVVQSVNHDPIISNLIAYPRKIDLGDISHLTCIASDPDGDSLSYFWNCAYGTINDSGATASWTAPTIAGNYYITCIVEDDNGGQAKDSIGIVVRDFSIVQIGKLVAFYPFDGNANDESGNGHNGTVYGATLVTDRLGNPNSAYSFDGLNDYILVPNHDSLNFQQSITVNFWMNIGQLYSREAFPISHGSWQNRWKVSIIPERKLRWTINSTNGIIDLDSETELTENVWHNYTVFYNGADYEIYIDGELDNFATWSGLIQTTNIDLTIGQMLPNNSNYNFKGVIDDITIFNYGLSVNEIQNLASGIIDIKNSNSFDLPKSFRLDQNYPNPFNPSTTIQFSIPSNIHVILKIFDTNGREVTKLIDKRLVQGVYNVNWNANGLASGIYFCRINAGKFSRTKKMILIK